MVAESTSINLFKVLAAALKMPRGDAYPVRERELPDRPVHSRGLVELLGRLHLRLVAADDLEQALGAYRCAHVDAGEFSHRAIHDLAALTAAAHAAGVLAIWICPILQARCRST